MTVTVQPSMRQREPASHRPTVPPVSVHRSRVEERRVPLHPLSPLVIAWRHRELLWQMIKRDVIGRYRGSLLGVLWSFLTPLAMLAIYSFVFGVVLQVRWRAESQSQIESSLILFAGLVVYGLFAECLTRAPGLIVNNTNYVKKVIFPLEILPWVSMGTAVFHALMSFVVIFIFTVAVYGALPWTIITLPVIVIPFVLLTLGLCWLLASLGVFLRDVQQTVGLATNALLFLSPVLYPISSVPASVHPLLFANPLTFVVEQVRGALLWGEVPPWSGLAWYSVASVVIAWLGLWWFQKTRRGFADVL
jgi:lipopolysaccharide transport system permease protein